MKTTDRPVPTRRQFLSTTAGASAGMASWLALGKAPAFAQKRELTFLYVSGLTAGAVKG